MARETLKDFLITHIGADAGDKINYTVDKTGGVPGVPGGVPQGDGLGIEPNTGLPLLELENNATGLLGAYLSHIVSNASNFQHFTPNNAETISARRGDPLKKPDEHVHPDTPVHVPSYSFPNDFMLSAISNSGYFDFDGWPFDGLDTIILKTTGEAPPGTQPFGAPKRPARDLLKDINHLYIGDQPADFVVDASIKALRNNNRFNDAVAANFENGTAGSDSLTPTITSDAISIQSARTLAEGSYDSDSYLTSIDKLSHVAASLMLRATGYNTSNTNIPEDDSAAGALIGAEEGNIDSVADPGGRRVESDEIAKIDISHVRARNQRGAPATSTGDPAITGGRYVPVVPDSEGNDPAGGSTFGATYNYKIHFTGKGHAAHRAKAAMSIIAMYKLLNAAFLPLIATIANDEAASFSETLDDIAQRHDKTIAGALMLGESRRMTNLVANSYLWNNVLTPLKFDYFQCLNMGTKTLFGAPFIGTLTQPGLDAAALATGITARHRYSDSPGYWSAVADSVIRETNFFLRRIVDIDPSDYASMYEASFSLVSLLNGENRIIKFLNVVAMIGEKALEHSNARSDSLSADSYPRDPDQVPNIPGNRVGKSRVGNRKGETTGGGMKYSVASKQTMAWAHTSTPSMYLLPVNVVRAANRLNNTNSGAHPLKAMLGSQMYRNTYTSIDVDGTGNRIPNRVVKIVEDRLDAEYVPFYFQDLRTNEILSFHAFLKDLTDTITPQWSAISGYGRMDPVQQYQGTTRSLNVGFTVYATNREDFDEMWYKINKLVTMLYPQWTQGTFVHAGKVDDAFMGVGKQGSQFYQPFSQVLGASPIIRLRVGDVIKSNYSRFNLARVFGIGDPEVKAKPIIGDSDFFTPLSMEDALGITSMLQNIFNAIRDVLTLVLIGVMGSPHGLIEFASRFIPDIPISAVRALGNMAADMGSEMLAASLINGFANPWTYPRLLDTLQDPNYLGDLTKGYRGGDAPGSYGVYLKPNMVNGYFATSNDQTYYTMRRLRAKVEDTKEDPNGNVIYEVKISDEAAGAIDGEKVLARHEDIYGSINERYINSTLGDLIAGFGLDLPGGLIDKAFQDSNLGTANLSGAAGINFASSLIRLLLENPEASFMRPEVNPYVKAFHQTRGRGLAGVMKGITFNWLDGNIPWETDYNARAPIGCDITFGFDVIHDIPPGIAHDGYNRAPLYNVGQIMRNVSGDVYDELLSVSELIFRKGGIGSGAGNQVRSTGTPDGGGA